MKILPILTSALLLCSCTADRETEALKNSLSEAQTAVRLSAENTKRLEDTYSDIYFHLDSLTVESFKKRVANGDTVYAYIGRPSCGDCNAFEPMFKRYIASSTSTACTKTKKHGPRSANNTNSAARPS